MHFLPDNDGILVRAKDKDLETDSGLSLAKEKRRIVDRPSAGEVVAIGPSVTKVGVGDYIYFDKYKVIEIVNADTGEALGALREIDYLGKIV